MYVNKSRIVAKKKLIILFAQNYYSTFLNFWENSLSQGNLKQIDLITIALNSLDNMYDCKNIRF